MADLLDRRVADYFIHCGLPSELCELDTPLEDFPIKPSHNYAPITDVTIIFPAEEPVPSGYKCVEKTPTGLSADLNHGSLRSKEVLLCYKRGWDKPPLVDVGVLYDGKEYVMPDSQVVEFTPTGRVANVNNSSTRTYITYRRADLSSPCNELVVTDICVIVLTKDEVPPHTYCIIPKTLNKGMVGSDVYICYKKSMRQPTRIVYKPGLLGRYPLEDREYFPLPYSVPLFCLPMGATVELWPAQAAAPKPVFSTFVFTVADGAEKVYGSSITFYERYSSSELTAQQRLQLGVDTHHPSEVSINTNKSICLLSHWPFFDTFAKFLMFLHELSVSGRSTAVPLERYISHFLLEVPFPSVSRPHVQVQLDAGRLITVSQPHFSPLPQTGASFYELLRNLGPDNCLLLLTYTLAEQKLLLHSLRPDVLTRVAETVHLMIFPLQWQCPYIPLCPLGLADILSAPVPFLVGLDSRYFDMYDPPPDVTCIDLDTNTIFVAEEKRHVAAKLLPKKPAKVLRCTLDAVYNKLYSMNRKNKSSNHYNEGSQQRIKYQLGLEIQEAFLRFMTSVLRGYRSYLKPIKAKPQQGTTDPSSLFNMEGFLKSRDKACHPFYQMITPTQMFIRFIEERSFVTEKDAHLVFFDECLEKSIDSPDCCLLDMDSLQSERTVFVPPPEPMDKQFVYNEFGQLHPQLFMSKCTSLSQLSAPRASIVSTLGGPVGASPSPMVRRTKHEVISARKLALKQSEKPALWASHLIGTCFSLWFVHLPCYVESSDNPKAVMDEAFQLMISMQKILQNNIDEVCYRVIMQLCGQLSLPILAVKVLYRMKQLGVHPNALTYGYYNRAVLESEWPTDCSSPGRVLWVRLRNVVLASAEFRAAQKRRERKNIAATDRAPSNLSIVECDLVSTPSMGSAQSLVARRKEMKSGRDLKLDLSGSASFRARVGRIVRSCNLRNTDGALKIPSPNFDTSAGVLMVTCSDEMADATACSPRTACQPPGLDSPHHDRSSTGPDLLESQTIDLLRCTNFAGDDSILERVRETRTAAARTTLSSIPAAAAEQPDSSCSPQLVRSLSTSQQLDRTSAPVSCSPRSVSDVTGDLLLAGAGGGGPRSCAEGSGSASSLSQRIAVTRDDPLGAFSNGSLSVGEQHAVQQRLVAAPSDSRTTAHARRNLFEAEPFVKGFSNPVGDDRAVNRSGSLRATSSSSSAGFRLPFSRIEQASNVAGGRLRMAERKFRKHFDTIQPEINGLMKSYSPSSLKNHELVKSGVSSIRSAATSMYKKLDEIKDAMSNQNPGLIKTMSLTSVDDDDPVEDLHLPIVSDFLPGSSETWSDTAFESQFSSKAALNTLLPDALPSPLPPVALELCLTSCCRCYNCQTVVYDEQIMAGWTAEDSNLNSKCPLCRRPFVPLLTVNVLDLRNISRSERLAEELKPLEQCTAGIQLEAITVPYLSPLVLRKEVENVMEHDGVGCLSATQFVDQHPIIYWNMVWFMQRINGPSHLSGLCLSSNTLTQNWQPAAGWEDVDWRYVRVRCFWDNSRLHEEVARPLYLQLKEDPSRSSLFDALVTERSTAKNMIYTVLTFVQYDRLDLVLQVLSEHIATRRLRDKHVSVYWDILFLVHSALGRDNIDIISYDREYRRAFEASGPDVTKNFTSIDRPPRPAELYCRRVFTPLDI